MFDKINKKESTNFRICYTYKQDDEIRFSKWIPYTEATNEQIEKSNQRELLKTEIVLDLDDKTKSYPELIEKLKKDKIYFTAYSTKSKSTYKL